MKIYLLIFSLVLHVPSGGSIGAALDSARAEFRSSGEGTTIYIAPGTYYEELTIDIPAVRLINASFTPSVALYDGGVRADENAVRISWYCGHGYQYRSMGEQFNYGGRRVRRWNASVLVTAPDFYAENIIFENSFNQYISPAELLDSLYDISQAKVDWTDKERPKRVMPTRPREAFSTAVQYSMYNERASALSLTSDAKRTILKGCRVVGHQDALYGDHGASLRIEGGVVQGTVDYIFGGMDVTAENVELVIGDSYGGKQCYIAAGRGYVADTKRVENVSERSVAENVSERSVVENGTQHGTLAQASLSASGTSSLSASGTSSLSASGTSSDSISTPFGKVPADEVAEQGMIFRRCVVRYATTDEVKSPTKPLVYLARPWRWWGTHLFEETDTRNVNIHPDTISLGLTKGHPAPFVKITDF